jgi:hypothetical protein
MRIKSIRTERVSPAQLAESDLANRGLSAAEPKSGLLRSGWKLMQINRWMIC